MNNTQITDILNAINKLNTLGKTKQIADVVNHWLKILTKETPE